MRRVVTTVAVLSVIGVCSFLVTRNHNPVSLSASVPSSPPTPGRSEVVEKSQALPLPRFRDPRGNGMKLDLSSPGYNPRRLQKAGYSAAEIFEDEPRNERWASAVESQVGGQVSSDLQKLVPGAQEVTMECRSRSCRMTYVVPSIEDMRAGRAFLRLLGPGPVRNYSGGRGPTQESLYILFSSKEDAEESDFDSAAIIERYKDKRRKILNGIRSKSIEIPPELAKSNWEML